MFEEHPPTHCLSMRPLVSAFEESHPAYRCCCHPCLAVPIVLAIECTLSLLAAVWVLLAVVLWHNPYAAWTFTIICANLVTSWMLLLGLRQLRPSLLLPYIVIKAVDLVLGLLLAAVCLGVLAESGEMATLMNSDGHLWNLSVPLAVVKSNHIPRRTLIQAMAVLSILLVLLFLSAWFMAIAIKSHKYISQKLRVYGTHHTCYNEAFSLSSPSSTLTTDDFLPTPGGGTPRKSTASSIGSSSFAISSPYANPRYFNNAVYQQYNTVNSCNRFSGTISTLSLPFRTNRLIASSTLDRSGEASKDENRLAVAPGSKPTTKTGTPGSTKPMTNRQISN